MPASTPTTVLELLAPASIDFATLHERYGALLELPRRMLGVVPNCHPYLEIWPPGLRTYNLLIPNMLNMPLLMWGLSAPAPLVGLAMYTSSRTAECMYCSAHSCSFAMRRGLDAAVLAGAMEPGEARSEVEQAVIAVARGLSTVPASLAEDDLARLRRLLPAAKAEWIVIVVIMMGFLQKCMNTLAVDLENAVFDDVDGVISESGWAPGRHRVKPDENPTLDLAADSFGRRVGLLPLLPAAVAHESGWIKGVPKSWPAAGDFLREAVGHDFGMLSGLGPSRVIRALTTVLRDNLSAEDSVLGLPTKLLVGHVYAVLVGNESLQQTTRTLASTESAALPVDQIEAIERWIQADADLEDEGVVQALMDELRAIEGLDEQAIAALPLALAASRVDSRITGPLLIHCGSNLEPAAVIELIVWVSLQQLLHRLTLAYPDAA